MRRIKWISGAFAILGGLLAIFFVLRSENALLTHPKGMIAQSELKLIAINYLLMFIVIIPTFIFLFITVWKYSVRNSDQNDLKDRDFGKKVPQLLLWIIPCPVIAVMIVITWKAAHKLDPYEPIKREVNPLTIQVVALDWKWLFLYPEQGIATLNFVQFPAGTPVHFELAADGSPMNSFWIPQLSGQIYSMTGMTTHLHVMADESGIYSGRAAEINGEVFADMTFVAKSTSQLDFDDWINHVKQSPLQLTEGIYNELTKPSLKHPITLYSYVEKDLFNKIIMKYMHSMH